MFLVVVSWCSHNGMNLLSKMNMGYTMVGALLHSSSWHNIEKVKSK